MEVKEISDGYARNFLIPRKLAVPAMAANLTAKAAFDDEQARLTSKAREQASRLPEIAIKVAVAAGTHGEVFGSVTADQISDALRQAGFSNFSLELQKSIRSIGEHHIPVSFGHGISADAKVIVEPKPAR